MPRPDWTCPAWKIALGVAMALALAACRRGSPSPSTTDAQLEQARAVYEQAGAKAALPQFEAVLTGYRAEGNRRGEAITLGLIGNCHKRLGDRTRALDLLSRALEMKRELGDEEEVGRTLSHLGLVYWELGEYDRAIAHFTEAARSGERLGSPRLEASALNNLALVRDERGEYAESRRLYERALALHRQAGFTRGESDTLGNLGGLHLLLGRYREAEDHYRQALAISERAGDTSAMSQDLGNLAACRLGLGRPDEAIALYDRALSLAREAGLAKEEADWLRGRATAQRRAGRVGAAFDDLQAALQAYERAGLDRELVDALDSLATMHLAVGDLAGAEQGLARAGRVADAIGYHRGATRTRLTLGALEWRRRRPAQAWDVLADAARRAGDAGEQALEAEALVLRARTGLAIGRLTEGRTAAARALTTAESAGAAYLQAEAHHALAAIALATGHPDEALAAAGRGASVGGPHGDPDISWRLAFVRCRAFEAKRQVDAAIAACIDAVRVIEDVRSRLREERYRAGFLEDKHEAYATLVRLLVSRGRAGDAFAVAERLRANTVARLAATAPPPQGGDAARAAAGRELGARITALLSSLDVETARPPAERRTAAIDSLSAELDAAQREYLQATDAAAAAPGAGPGPGRVAIAPARLARALSRGAALVAFVTAEDASTVFVLSSDGLRARSLPIGREALQARVELLRDLVSREGDDNWETPAGGLFEVLLAPLERAGWLVGVRHLYLVPHGVLHYLPFAALRDARGRTLAERYALTVLPSAARLVSAQRPGQAPRDLLALAPAEGGLAHAGDEVRAVAGLFAEGSRSVLLGRQATEAAFKREAPRHRVLHLTAHGAFDRLNPLLSAISLEPGGEDDGRLEAYEILDLRLDADLVTLSACQTGLAGGLLADIPAGEDFVGLTRAFLEAGSDAVLATLWDIDDRATGALMRRFYELSRETSRAEALARVQREALARGGREAHPHFWAPFVIVGEAPAVPPETGVAVSVRSQRTR